MREAGGAAGGPTLRLRAWIGVIGTVWASCSSPQDSGRRTPVAPAPGQGIEAGLREYREGRFDAAAEAFRAAAGAQPTDPAAHYYLGSALLQLERHRAALDALNRALDLREAFPEARLARARVWIRMGEYPPAEGDLRRALDLQPDSLPALFNLGFVLYRTGKYEEAMERLETVRALHPNHPDAPYLLGKAAMRLGLEDRARREFEATIRLDPKNAGAHFNLGNLLVRAGKASEGEELLARFKALSDAETAREHRLEVVNGLVLEGYLLQKEGRMEEAIGKYRAALEVEPDHVPTHKDLAILHLAEGRMQEGLASLLRATEIDPNYAPAWFHLARVYERLGDRERAEAAAERYRLLEASAEARREEPGRW